MQAQSQFSPDQLIAAGRRAEGQGQGSYALQFYTYIAEHFPASTEAYEARDAIYRLSPAGGAQTPAASYVPQPAPAPTLDIGAGPSHGAPGATRRGDGRKRRLASHVHDASEVDDGGPSYRIGRFVAMMLGTMGWLLLLASVLMIPLITAALTLKSMPKGLRDGIVGNLLVVSGATFGMLFLGLLAIFAAQAARATFDTAEAVRRLLPNGNDP